MTSYNIQVNELESFSKLASDSLDKLFLAAKANDEFAFVFALLGFNSGMEDAGWQPIAETWKLHQDVISIVNTPLEGHTKIRLLLLLYCQITEASYPYHVIYNMLLSVERATPPKIFNFLQQYQNGVPPSVKIKVKLISEKAVSLRHENIKQVLDIIFDARIRNAVSHADYILHQDTLRLKHKGREIIAINLDDVLVLMNKAISFFEIFFDILQAHKRTYENDYVITGRKNISGNELCSIKIIADPQHGVTGFSTLDPLPLW